ncbi:DNA-binding SARP family transcriptional activator/tetratricopeptide (TPR) repeat protein [Saccharothrix tamanrassetensis]|uniref:DNA-binding SARP family transcriptional activator/tetratricopeptide (TPR) repeat protein n=1 Tax=Saccharothrix tamanrassetensis TaxID=1051531 RepID=A0A841CU84_9PSEU|nr:BTAD domain-containing putative transcriptional regulator [Saccharothrix tamanrassetensis]MBB5960403.1 DNA-binding SARP family transcriptional activator/tetratricopeptide (TPR) repeat protein [Saccharothrix tamanrassetensis]
MAVEFRLLGSVEVRVDGEPVDVGPARQRCLLAALLVEPNHPVPADRLVDRVWADRSPRRARETLRTYLTRLRHALAGTDEVRIGRGTGGYVFTVDPAAVDLHRFRHLVAGARAADRPAALDLLGRALALCRGEPFAGLDSPWISAVRAEVEAERTAAELDHTDLLLHHGRHGEVVAGLRARAVERPLDERLAGQLVLALYRCGRQADALDHCRRVHTRLAEELGVDPSPPLRRLHQQVLAADPALALPPSPSDATRPEGGGRPSPVPRQLPAPSQLFTGRSDELRCLATALDAPANHGATLAVSAIGGTGGIGKTWLALHWAHHHLDRFPDGQLYANLRGFDPGAEPLSPAAAVRGFLDALGVAPASVPPDADAQSALYRSLVAGKRVLIVLDNAAGTDQVVPLLPGSPTCTVLITSRDKLTGLVTTHGARPLLLDVLGHEAAGELLARPLGADRLAAEPEAVEELLRHCAGLPLALGIVAARAATHPDLPLRVLADELRDRTTRLDALDTGEADLNVRAVFACSHHALDTEAATLLGLLGVAPGPDIGLAAAASLAALPRNRTALLLRKLETAHLVQQHRPGRYRMHDLIRLCAAEQAHRDLTEDTRVAALRRLVDFYTHTAYAGDRLLEPHREPLQVGTPVAECRPEPLPDQAAALSWFEAEHACLLAAHRLAVSRCWHTSVWRLAWVLRTFHRRRGLLHDDLAVWRAGLTAVERLGDVAAQIRAHRFLGHTWSESGRSAEAVRHLERARSLAEQTNDTATRAHVHMALGWMEKARDADRRALDHVAHAARLYRTLDNPVWEADALATTGWFHAESGRYDQARTHCEAALPVYRVHHDREGEADALNSLGYIAHHTGLHTEALDHYRQARTLFRDLGHTYNEADTLDRIGETHAVLGRPGPARDAWHQALQLYLDQQRVPDTERVRQQLAALEDD